ncbi:MAG: hypothetical protein QW140_00340 [Candidatus Aenigmatarchaeota archaeon]
MVCYRKDRNFKWENFFDNLSKRLNALLFIFLNMGVDYEALIKRVLSQYPGLTPTQIEIEIIKILKTSTPIEKVDFNKMYSSLSDMENRGVVRREKWGKYFLSI